MVNKFHTLTYILLCTLFFSNQILSSTDVNVGYPAMRMDYKITIDAGREDCVYQYVHEGAVFYVDFQVIRGGDGQAIFYIKNPQSIIVFPHELNTKATYETVKAIDGYYAVCIDNQYSTFSNKLVSVYMATYEAEGWDRYVADLNEINLSSEIFIQTFSGMAQKISQVLQYLHHSRSQETKDYALLVENNYNVSLWSLIQCIIILGSGLLHVYIIRQFFCEIPSHRKYKVQL